MRIAFDARYINDRYHGIGRYAFRLLEALASDSHRLGLGHTFTVYRGAAPDTRFDWHALLALPNVRMRQGPAALYLPTEQLAWARLLRREPPDLFHSPYFVAPLLAPRRLPVIVTVHDLIFDRFPQYMPMAWSRPYYRLMLGLSLRRATATAAISHATARDLERYYPPAAGKIAITAEGVDPDFSPPASWQAVLSLRQRYDLRQPYILSVGARRPHKNLARLVRAFAQAASAIPHELVFAGPPDERFPDEARLEAARLGMNRNATPAGRVRFLDWVPEADLPLLYAGAELVALPSLIEGFGLPALEAMACGAPVLASHSSSFPEVLGEAGCLVDPLDEQALAQNMALLLGDANLRRAMSQAGLQRARAFTWAKAAAQFLNLYEQVQA
jgi:glycosyltransferase involved in cell wall biosynthesis